MTERVPRVNELIRRELSQILLKEVDFPEGVLSTITRVETSANLIKAKVFISAIPENKITDILKILKKEVFYLQQILNKRLRMRPVPKIIFVEEKQTKEAARIEEILEELKKKGK